jgi:hypothetical protein
MLTSVYASDYDKVTKEQEKKKKKKEEKQRQELR